jgi:hypothetical protein
MAAENRKGFLGRSEKSRYFAYDGVVLSRNSGPCTLDTGSNNLEVELFQSSPSAPEFLRKNRNVGFDGISRSDGSSYDRRVFNNDWVIPSDSVRVRRRQLPQLHMPDLGIRKIGADYSTKEPAPLLERHRGFSAHRERELQWFRSVWKKFMIVFGVVSAVILLLFLVGGAGKGSSGSHLGYVSTLGPVHQFYKVLPENPGGIDGSNLRSVRDNGSGRVQIAGSNLLPQLEGMPENIDSSVVSSHSEASGVRNPVEEVSIIGDPKLYYVKVDEVESVFPKLNKVCKVEGVGCNIKIVKVKTGDKQRAILIGPFETKDRAVDFAGRNMGTGYVCSVVSVSKKGG